MALNHTVSYTFAPNTTISSSQVNTDISDIANVFNGLEAKTKTLAALKVDVDPSTALEVSTKQYVDHYSAWKRPTLSVQSVTTVDVKVNTGTANTTSILFPDGNLRTVTENTGATHKYRRFDITATAEFTTGTEDSGMKSGVAEAANISICIYAVKSLISSSNFVLVGDTTEPIQANFAALNSSFGTNGWVYLGTIFNGDGSGATSDILDAKYSGNMVLFMNSCTTQTFTPGVGRRLATTASAASSTYTYAAGCAANQLPGNLELGLWRCERGVPGGSSSYSIRDSSGTRIYRSQPADSNNHADTVWIALGEGCQALNGGGQSSAHDICLAGFIDGALGIGSNPQI